MDKENLGKWILWAVLVVVVVVALLFVGYGNGRVFKPNQTVDEQAIREQIESLSTDVGIDEINDDVQFDEVINESEEVDFID